MFSKIHGKENGAVESPQKSHKVCNREALQLSFNSQEKKTSHFRALSKQQSVIVLRTINENTKLFLFKNSRLKFKFLSTQNEETYFTNNKY